MRRREFITLIGCAAAWPVGVVAQQPAIPVIGYLSFRSANESASVEAAFREGLSEIGYSPEGSSQRADAQGVASRLNLKLVIMNARTEREIDAAFANAQQQVGAVI